VRLRARVADACPRKSNLRAALAKQLRWPNLSRLDAYVSGKHFPSPSSLKTIADLLGDDWLDLAAEAGYLREVIDALDAISEFDDEADRKSLRSRGVPAELLGGPSPRTMCATYVRYRFRLREEGSAQAHYGGALAHSVMSSLADRAQAKLDGRHRPHRLIRFAKNVLAMNEIDSEARVAIASKLMLAWADVLDSQGKVTP